MTAVRIAVIVGEVSGDALGAKLIPELRALAGGREIEFIGTAGPAMENLGMRSFFPLDEIAVMGFIPVIKRLPLILRRIHETADRVIAAEPDALIIIDSPDFTHRVAKRVKAALPHIPIVDYVSPSVWAWRPGRAKQMRRYIDHVLALLPFEPDAHQRLGGPACTYVGHPLIERLSMLRPSHEENDIRKREKRILVLPGSRRSEITRLMPIFRDVVHTLYQQDPSLTFYLPAVDHLCSEVEQAVMTWPVKPVVLRGEDAKYHAFRVARAALAASGTVTLELALAQVPMVVAYRVSPIESLLRFLIQVPSIVLPNLILGHRPVPEFLQEGCTASNLTTALTEVTSDGQPRSAQLGAFSDLDRLMQIGDERPSERAARIIFETLSHRAQPTQSSTG